MFAWFPVPYVIKGLWLIKNGSSEYLSNPPSYFNLQSVQQYFITMEGDPAFDHSVVIVELRWLLMFS